MFTSLVFHGAYRRHDVRHRALFAAQLWTIVRNSYSRLELKWLNRTVAVQLSQKICRWLEPPARRALLVGAPIWGLRQNNPFAYDGGVPTTERLRGQSIPRGLN
jgi:hypothetical protein